MLTVHQTKEDFVQSDCTTVVLPLGAVEQHGTHLPLGTDYFLAQEFARRLAEPLDAYLLPAIPITSSIEHGKRNGTVSIKAETLALIIRDIGESLCESGFKKLVLVNFHGGNWIVKPTIRSMNRVLKPFLSIQIDALIAFNEHPDFFDHIENDVHAGEFETSIMMHTHPELVGPIKAADKRRFVPQPFMDYFDVPELTSDGSWGFPEAATAGKGLKAMGKMVEAALAYIRLIEETADAIRRDKE